MLKTPTRNGRNSAILKRAIQPNESNLSPGVARALLRFQLAPEDSARLKELLAKNQEDLLTADERDELDEFLNIGMLLDLLQAKARAALNRASKRSARAHG